MPTSIHDILDELFESATDERDKGDKFERLMKAYLQTDPVWNDRFSNVWMWMEWPGRAGRPDTGIDLVAQERETGEFAAIQCKFYSPNHYLQKDDIDSFFTASGKAPFASRIIISTTDKWGKNAEEALEGQQIPVTRIRVQDLDDSSIDWAQFSLVTPEVMELKDRKRLRPHQEAALKAVREGFDASARGKLIMACGTGKTFTSLRIAEDLVPAGGSVLFLVPSISLLSQTLKEWTAQALTPLRPFAVCSDTKVGKRTQNEDIAPYDLAFPASTDASKLYNRVASGQGSDDKITVIFSTYQSLPVVAAAQERGLPDFDLVICDEAHRTTGVTLAGEDESNFVRIHQQAFIRSDRRLYMTATPRIYEDSSKVQALEGAAVLASMDDAELYGPEFHRLGFGEAVNRGLLTDYKVLVLAVDEQAVSTTFQSQLADVNNELGIDDAAKIVGCWNGLAKKGRAESGFGDDDRPMGRAVAFARSIKDSERFTRLFTDIVDEYHQKRLEEGNGGSHDATSDTVLCCEAKHVDGTFNVLRRNERLDWLKSPLEPNSCRILSNARCLSEGVDVPDLDAVIFLNPRNSIVDVVQSVGRIMRKAPEKQYGYVILPIGIPANMTPEQALANNEKYKVVWQVLQALRAHDERFNAMVNQIDLNKAHPDRLQVIGVSGFDTEDDSERERKPQAVQQVLDFPHIGEWRDVIYAKIVTKVGDRRYWEDWAKDVASIAERHITRIHALLDDPRLDVQKDFHEFLTALRANLNSTINADDAIGMLAQHLVTRPVFDALFQGHSFTEQNPVSQVMQRMLESLDEQQLEAENATLEAFYDSVRLRAEGIDNAAGRQRIVTELYEKFFKLAFPQTAQALGIVYTPTEIVDFIIRSVERLLREEFGTSLSAEGVHVLDPFTGTGTFMARILQSGLIRPDDVLRKYAQELHANEILLLAYYIAAINIEAAFNDHFEVSDEEREYMPFEGIVLADTFAMSEGGGTLDDDVFTDNIARADAQKRSDIRVIVSNPPWRAGGKGANQVSASVSYPSLDAMIARDYVAQSSSTTRTSVYDSYIRAIRWATERIGTAGIIGYVTNNGWLDSNTADGLRKALGSSFTDIYIFNLKGNSMSGGEAARKEGGNVFPVRVGVAIVILVLNPDRPRPGVVHYHSVPDALSGQDKLRLVDQSRLEDITWSTLVGNEHGDWLSQRDESFASHLALAKKGKSDPDALLSVYTQGVMTTRDAWVYNSCADRLRNNVRSMIDVYNRELDMLWGANDTQWIRTTSDSDLGAVLDRDPRRISWGKTLFDSVRANRRFSFHEEDVRVAQYRPFDRRRLYFHPDLNHSLSTLPTTYPASGLPNFGFYVVGKGSAVPFSVLMTDAIPDRHLTGAGSGGQFYPRWRYIPAAGQQSLLDEDHGYARLDNVSDTALAAYRRAYGPDVTKDDIYFYVYGLLHSTEYRSRWQSDLKKSLPRVPMVGSLEGFRGFASAGRALSELHVGYETVTPFPLAESGSDGRGGWDHYRVEKMVWPQGQSAADKPDSLVYNSRVTVSGIPGEAYEYRIGSRSAIEWAMRQYQVKTEPTSGLINDPNDLARESGDPRYILGMLERIVTVSVETVRIVGALPPLDI